MGPPNNKPIDRSFAFWCGPHEITNRNCFGNTRSFNGRCPRHIIGEYGGWRDRRTRIKTGLGLKRKLVIMVIKSPNPSHSQCDDYVWVLYLVPLISPWGGRKHKLKEEEKTWSPTFKGMEQKKSNYFNRDHLSPRAVVWSDHSGGRERRPVNKSEQSPEIVRLLIYSIIKESSFCWGGDG